MPDLSLTFRITPSVEKGVPLCAGDECPVYDGKRCGLTGNPVYRVCEPAVQQLFNRCTELEAQVAALTSKETP